MQCTSIVILSTTKFTVHCKLVQTHAHKSLPKGDEIRDTKTLNLSSIIVSLQVLGRRFAFLTSIYRSIYRATKALICGRLKLLRKVKHKSTLSDKFCLCCSLFIKLETYHVTNAPILDPHQANQPHSGLRFFNRQQMWF